MTATILRRQLVGGPLSSELHPVIDRIYRGRGVTSINNVDTQAKHLLHYKSLNGIANAVSLLIDAIKTDKHIMIVGDFDADGATSTALCLLALRAMGARTVSYLVPNRFDFGYGLSPEIVDVAHQQGAQLIMTVDSGIACVPGVSHAKSLGLSVVVTDHHLPPSELPIADAIVNPNLVDRDFPSKNLAGVGVAFYLLSALRATLIEQGWFESNQIQPPPMAQWLDIVAVGTVADVVQLDSNNRILVHQGLQRIRAGKCRPGISAMLEIANRQAKYLSASDLVFVIGPRLNAAGRLDDMAAGIECLLVDDIYIAREKAAELDSLNQQRKLIEKDMKQEAEAIVAKLTEDQSQSLPAALILHHEDFHQGIIGIVAGRIKDKFNRPVIAFAAEDETKIKGSARSVESVHVRDALEEVQRRSPNILHKFGGHAMAAGLTLDKANLSTFQELFVSVIEAMREGIPEEQSYHTDGPLPAECFTLDFANLINQSGPYGQGFPAPSFDDRFALMSHRIVGENHLKMTVCHESGLEFDAIAFNVDTQVWPNKQARHVHLVFSPDINVFRGQTRLQLMVEHIEVSL